MSVRHERAETTETSTGQNLPQKVQDTGRTYEWILTANVKHDDDEFQFSELMSESQGFDEQIQRIMHCETIGKIPQAWYSLY
eukprot:2322224-Rhodomonas_salina.1